METRYQVFVSSTYEDLKSERQAVMHALLELDCIPSGMELFPAADEDQWSLIQSVIDDCDYYVLILGGRYGSVGPDGLGYTEKEYRYALETGKPIAAFTHRDPGKIASGLSEQLEEGRAKLASFRDLVRRKLCKSWETPDELAGVVSRSMLHLIKRYPAVGWVRGDNVTNAAEVLGLKRQIESLESRLNSLAENPPEGSEMLSQGTDVYTLNVRFAAQKREDGKVVTKRYTCEWDFTWDEFLSCLGPLMLMDATENRLRRALEEQVQKEISEMHNSEEFRVMKCEYVDDPFNVVIIQLRALGLIAKSTRPRSVSDHNTYWTLTPLGDRRLTELMAIPKDAEGEDEDEEEEAKGLSKSASEGDANAD